MKKFRWILTACMYLLSFQLIFAETDQDFWLTMTINSADTKQVEEYLASEGFLFSSKHVFPVYIQRFRELEEMTLAEAYQVLREDDPRKDPFILDLYDKFSVEDADIVLVQLKNESDASKIEAAMRALEIPIQTDKVAGPSLNKGFGLILTYIISVLILLVSLIFSYRKLHKSLFPMLVLCHLIILTFLILTKTFFFAVVFYIICEYSFSRFHKFLEQKFQNQAMDRKRELLLFSIMPSLIGFNALFLAPDQTAVFFVFTGILLSSISLLTLFFIIRVYTLHTLFRRVSIFPEKKKKQVDFRLFAGLMFIISLLTLLPSNRYLLQALDTNALSTSPLVDSYIKHGEYQFYMPYGFEFGDNWEKFNKNLSIYSLSNGKIKQKSQSINSFTAELYDTIMANAQAFGLLLLDDPIADSQDLEDTPELTRRPGD
jgi:hypothetical protein